MVWYEKYGMNENVFNPQKILSKEIKGEEEVIDDINGHIKDGNICLLYGEAGTGKTTILRDLAKSNNGIYINCETFGDKDIKKELKSIKNLIKKKIVFLDEIHFLNKMNLGMVKGLYDDDNIKALVCSQIERNFDNSIPDAFKERVGDDKVSTKKPSAEECIAIVEERIKDNDIFEKGVIQKIAEYNYNNPRRILKQCGRLCKYKDGDKPITIEDYQKFLKDEPKEEELQRSTVKEESSTQNTGDIKLSKTQSDILDFLRSGAKGLDQVANHIKKGQGPTGTQLKRMEGKGAVIITKEGTKKMYDIKPEYKITILKDGGRDE